jgi:hypothetical protein
LESCTVGEPRLAEQLRTKYCKTVGAAGQLLYIIETKRSCYIWVPSIYKQSAPLACTANVVDTLPSCALKLVYICRSFLYCLITCRNFSTLTSCGRTKTVATCTSSEVNLSEKHLLIQSALLQYRYCQIWF